MEENVAQNFSQPHFRALLLLIFAGLALVIAAVGVYGVMAYSTAQRSGEMAIRMALGCSVERIFTLVLTDGLRLTLIGVTIGTALSIVLGPSRTTASSRSSVGVGWELSTRLRTPSLAASSH
jgi:ABC-type antimicrobial peptide transport system permease subunit